MICIIDYRSPQVAIERLKSEYDVLLFSSSANISPALKGHPDLFMCHCGEQVVISPDCPKDIIENLNHFKINYTIGLNSIKNNSHNTYYNAVVSDNLLIHNKNYTDKEIIKICSNHNKIHVKQSFTRCSLLHLKDDIFITSDAGIYKTLCSIAIKVLYIKQEGIILPGYSNGCFGGCCGVNANTIYINGSLNKYTDGIKLRNFIDSLEMNIVELHNEALFDGGSIFFF